VNNYTDGFQSRIAVARTPDNTFARLADNPYVLTPMQSEHIQQAAHLLTMMEGELTLPKLENKGRQWLEGIRIESLKDYDRVQARQRFRICITAQRMTCCLMLCHVAEQLVKKHGYIGAERWMKQYPDMWKELAVKAQTPKLLAVFDVLANSLLDNALHFFRERIELAFNSASYSGSDRRRPGKNDSIFARLDTTFTLDQAMQQAIVVKGTGASRNSVYQMLKNWRKQGLVTMLATGHYRKVE